MKRTCNDCIKLRTPACCNKDQANELQSILAELRRTLTTMADENQKLIEVAKYYGYEEWGSVMLLDRGACARHVYEQVIGRRFGEQVKG